MRRQIIASLITVVLIASVAMLSGCVEKVRVGELRTDSQSVELDGVESVNVEIDVGAGTINATDLTREGNVYTNDAYGKSDVTLSIDIEAGVGEINLELEGVSTKSKGGKR